MFEFVGYGFTTGWTFLQRAHFTIKLACAFQDPLPCSQHLYNIQRMLCKTFTLKGGVWLLQVGEEKAGGIA